MSQMNKMIRNIWINNKIYLILVVLLTIIFAWWIITAMHREVDIDLYPIIYHASKSSARFLMATVPFMIIGVFLAELIVALRIMDKVAFLARPLTDFAHLRHECGASFVTAFLSPVSANSMLATYYEDEFINKRELFMASMMTSFPSIVMHWRSMLPVLIPLLGVTGVIYFCLLMFVGLLQTLLIIIGGRLLLQKNDCLLMDRVHSKRPPLKDAIRMSIITSEKTAKRILFSTVPTTFIVFLLIAAGFLDVLTSQLGGIANYFPIPPAGLSIVVAQFANFLAAQTIAGNLLSQGILSSREILLALLVGDVLSSITTIFRILMPYYVGIFGFKIGMEIMILSTAIRTALMLIVIVIFSVLQ